MEVYSAIQKSKIATTLKYDELNVVMMQTVMIEQGYVIQIRKRQN